MASRNEVEMDRAGLVIVPPGRGSLDKLITPTEDHHVVAHLGIARVPHPENWTLRVGGAVYRPFEILIDDLTELPSRSIVTALECAGSPLKPDKPLRRVSTAVWRGVLLSDLLARAGPRDGSRYIWLLGADHGAFDGVPVDSYVKDLPLEKARDVLIAYEMNSEPLTPEHGFPVRAIVPGFYGTNSVKWLSDIEVATDRAESMFTTRLYNREVRTTSGLIHKPMWGVDVNSLLATPRRASELRVGEIVLSGFAWGELEVARMEVSVDGGRSWQNAEVAVPRWDHAWQPFQAMWIADEPGEYLLMVRATDRRGVTQPSSRHINQIQAVKVTVRAAEASG